MNKFDLVRKIEQFAPPETQESWDCSGWAVCTKNLNINKIMLALTVTDSVIKQAREQGCDMIISHHPLFFVPLEYSDIDIYTAHTNMDKADGGVTDTLIKELGLKSCDTVADFVRIVKLDNPTTVEEFANRLRKTFPNLRYVNNDNRKTLQTIGFCGGSGSDLLSELKNTDAFVTGDLKFHTALESKMVLFDIGHFESEIFILPVFKKILETDNIVFADEKSPFIYK